MKEVTQNILFTKEECNYFKNLLNIEDIEKTDLPAHGSFNITVGIIPPSKIPTWFINKIKKLKISDFEFQDKYKKSRTLFINKYTKGGYFEKHRDDYARESHWVNRYKTLIIQLSDTSEYSGGDFLVDDVKMNNTIGNCILFDSSIYHEVTEITDGERYSLTLWLDRDDINEKKHTL